MATDGIIPDDVVAHLGALAEDGHETLTPKTCGLCRWALENSEDVGEALAVIWGRAKPHRQPHAYQRPARPHGTARDRPQRGTGNSRPKQSLHYGCNHRTV